jgi:hypothetical protein
MTTLHDDGRTASTDFIDAARDYEQRQRRQSSDVTLTDHVTRFAAFGLVAASTTYGAFFAWHTAATVNGVLAIGALVFAVSLEIVKPQAFAAIFDTARTAPQRIALGLLALVAAVYSLTAELQLTATSRGDVVATRQAQINETKDASRQQAALESELASLPTTQPAEIAAKTSKLIADNPTARCDADKDSKEYGTTSKRVCPQIEALNAERSAADKAQARRAELTSILGGMSEPHTEAPAVDKADPGASALSVYLAVLGVAVKPDVLAEWLVLVPVLALELGSLFAGLLVASTPLPTANSAAGQGVRQPPKIEVAANSDGVQSKAPQPMAANTFAEHLPNTLYAAVPMTPVLARSANTAAARLVEYVRGHGGVVQISTRRLADALATKHSTLTDAVEALEATGILSAVPGKRGTTYRLASISAASH